MHEDENAVIINLTEYAKEADNIKALRKEAEELKKEASSKEAAMVERFIKEAHLDGDVCYVDDDGRAYPEINGRLVICKYGGSVDRIELHHFKKNGELSLQADVKYNSYFWRDHAIQSLEKLYKSFKPLNENK